LSVCAEYYWQESLAANEGVGYEGRRHYGESQYE
jgi:hypothetical protein